MYPEAITLHWQALQFCRNGVLKIDMIILPVMLYIFDATCMYVLWLKVVSKNEFKSKLLSVWNVKKRSVPFITVTYIGFGGVNCSAKKSDMNSQLLGLFS